MKGGGPWPWTPEEDRLIAGMLEAGQSFTAIAARLGRPESTVRRRAKSRQYLENHMARSVRHWRKDINRRRCLCCGMMFEAEEDYRICPPCKQGEEWASGIVEMTLRKPKK